MKLLLDTHVVLWWLDEPSQLSEAARVEITNTENTVLVSAVVAWEIGIKRELGKPTAPTDLEAAITAAGFDSLPITIAHALGVESLPTPHRDPFDRLLVAQAILEGCTLVSRDSQQRQYPVPFLMA